MDSDSCLQKSEGWGESYNCSGVGMWECLWYAKDTQRCCPNTCQLMQFTEEECDSTWSDGTCTYPHDVECRKYFN